MKGASASLVVGPDDGGDVDGECEIAATAIGGQRRSMKSQGKLVS